MDAESCLRLAVRMRGAQKRYFASRTQENLKQSKVLESEFDKAAKVVLHEPNLFDPPAVKPDKSHDAFVGDLPPAGVSEGCEVVVRDALRSVVNAVPIAGGSMRAKVKSDGQRWRIVEILA